MKKNLINFSFGTIFFAKTSLFTLSSIFQLTDLAILCETMVSSLIM